MPIVTRKSLYDFIEVDVSFKRYNSEKFVIQDAHIHQIQFAYVHHKESCFNSQLGQELYYHKIAWIFTKVNYVLTGGGLLFNIRVLVMLSKYEDDSDDIVYLHLKSLNAFNILWLLWRFQQSLNWDTGWQKYVPYICHVTNAIEILSESVEMYTVVSLSLQRAMSILYPIRWRLFVKRKLMLALIILVSVILGGSSIILKTAAIFTLKNTETKTTCTILKAQVENLQWVIASTIARASVIFALPFLVTLISNIIVSYHVLNAYCCVSEKHTKLRRNRSSSVRLKNLQ